LQKDIDALRAELSALIIKRDELKYIECKNIEMQYMLVLGDLEYRLYEADCALCRERRKLEMIQAKLNRREIIVLGQVEKALDQEFEEYRKKLELQIAKMNRAIERKNAKAMTEAETKEFKKMYREIVKTLHPDMNPNITPEQIQLFHNAVKAYENGDMASLRIISETVTDPSLKPYADGSIAALEKERDRLQECVDLINEMIVDIKKSYPYILKEIIEDPEKISTRKEEYTDSLAQIKNAIDVYRRRIEEALRCANV